MKFRIAIIDDESIVCQRLKKILENEGYQTETFQNGLPFLQRMETYAFNLVFLDLKLPDINGMEILSRLRERHEDTEVIIITGYGTIETTRKAELVGAFDFIAKPFQMSMIHKLVKKASKQARKL